LTRDVGISVSEFTLAIAVQNLAWGFLQPFAGALTVRYGFRPIMMVGAALYIGGLVLMASAHGLLSVVLGAGVLIGISLACTAAAIAMSVAARAVPATVRSTALGIISGVRLVRYCPRRSGRCSARTLGGEWDWPALWYCRS
jgi:MFS family permease